MTSPTELDAAIARAKPTPRWCRGPDGAVIATMLLDDLDVLLAAVEAGRALLNEWSDTSPLRKSELEEACRGAGLIGDS